MKADPRNPAGNALPKGTTEAAMEEAVARSGYPLQTEVAIALLARGMDVREEWSYADRDTEKLRAIDVMATREYETSDTTVVPRLGLVIECKRSEHPYVFFRSARDEVVDFPAIYGVPDQGFSLEVPGKGSTVASPAKTLGLADLSIVKSGPPTASTFARAELKGKKSNLSGDDVFSSIVMPLVGAMSQMAAMFSWWGAVNKKYPALALGIGVVDAPMLLADSRQKPHDLMLAPWVRVARQEVIPNAHASQQKVRFFAFDIVHSSFLDTFLDGHLLPSAAAYVQRVDKMQSVIRRGGGQVPSFEGWKWSDIRA